MCKPQNLTSDHPDPVFLIGGAALVQIWWLSPSQRKAA